VLGVVDLTLGREESAARAGAGLSAAFDESDGVD
jgi:hypothetical protein